MGLYLRAIMGIRELDGIIAANAALPKFAFADIEHPFGIRAKHGRSSGCSTASRRPGFSITEQIWRPAYRNAAVR